LLRQEHAPAKPAVGKLTCKILHGLPESGKRRRGKGALRV
jgi:hypothetical protein